MRILIVSQKVGEGYGQERIVSASTSALMAAGHQVEWVAEDCQGEVSAHAFHRIPDLFHLNSLSSKKVMNRALESLYTAVGRGNAQSGKNQTLVHFVDHLDGKVFTETAARFPTLFTAHTAAPTCPASGRVVAGHPVCPKKSGWSCLVNHYRYHCLSAQRTPLHRAHSVFEFQRRHEGLKSVKRLLAVSHFLEEQLIRDGYLRAKVAFVPNPVVPTEAAETIVGPPGLLVCAARLVSMKGIAHLIEALKTIEEEEWTLWIVGDGPEREALGGLVERLELSSRITFLGRKARKEVTALFRAATAVVQPNLGPEGFGLSIAEASALAKPVIAYDVPGLNEIIENEKTGLLVRYGDITALGLALSRILENPELGRQMGEAGASRIQEQYSIEKHREETLKNYQLVLGN